MSRTVQYDVHDVRAVWERWGDGSRPVSPPDQTTQKMKRITPISEKTKKWRTQQTLPSSSLLGTAAADATGPEFASADQDLRRGIPLLGSGAIYALRCTPTHVGLDS